jgi:transcriptional regulator with XRE-family HTH domain
MSAREPFTRAEQRKQQGARVAEARSEAQISKAELGRQLGYKAHHMYWRLEAGLRGYTPEQLLRVAQTTGVRLEWLIAGQGPKRWQPLVVRVLRALTESDLEEAWRPTSVRERVALSLSMAAAIE